MSDDLDKTFGRLRNPERIDKWEDRPPESLSNLNRQLADDLIALEKCAQSQLLKFSARTINYLWVVDEAGAIKISVEEIALKPPDAPRAGYPRRRGYRHISEEKKLGHPTLLCGGPARIAGELAFDEISGRLRWMLNANSGRYCRREPPTQEQIDAVATLFRELGVDLEVDYLI
jgi:hypothetical protein